VGRSHWASAGLAIVVLGCNFGSSSSGGSFDSGTVGFDVAGPSFEGGPDVGAESGAEGGPPCQPTGAPVTHATDVTSDETWASGVHVVPSSIQVKNGARLTIAGCSEVQLGPGASITAGPTAAGIDANGDAANPIRFVPQPAGTTPWGALEVVDPAVGRFKYTTISGGGTGPHDTAPVGGASLVARSTTAALPVLLDLEHVTVSGSGGLGIAMLGARFDPASIDLTVNGSGWYPVYAGVGSAGDLPSGAYTGNAVDQILLQTFGVASYDQTGALVSDVTIHDRGVPYRVGTAEASIVVGDGLQSSPNVTLTLEAGVTLLFTPQGTGGTSRILVNAKPAGGGTYVPQGALVASGTPASPVVLQSAAAAPAAGDWEGLYFAHEVATGTSIANAQILHAGGASGAVGICGSTPAAANGVATCAVVLMLDDPPPPFLSGSRIQLAPCGVYRGWKTTEVDFVSNNQFADISGCVQTSIPDGSNACAACATGP
jgi:hypothetical protein